MKRRPSPPLRVASKRCASCGASFKPEPRRPDLCEKCWKWQQIDLHLQEMKRVFRGE